MRFEGPGHAGARGGFTLFEVLAAVLILGLFYTVLADRAVRGLRSEGMDRRRTQAADVADRNLIELETMLASGAPLETFENEIEEGDYRVLVQVLPEDVEALLPQPLEPASPGAAGAESSPRLLLDEQGESRIYRLSVLVTWEEAGETHSLRRTGWDFDKSQLAALFPASGEEGRAGDTDAASGEGARDGSEEGGDGGSSSGGSRSQRGGREDACSRLETPEDLMRCMRSRSR